VDGESARGGFDTEDGREHSPPPMRFRNLDNPDAPLRSAADVLRWKLDLGPEKNPPPSPRRIEIPFIANDGRALAHPKGPTLTWIGHATYLLQLAGVSILTDPVLSPRVVVVPRNVRPGLTYETLPPIDIVTVSHNHYDHMDARTLMALGDGPTFVVPTGLGSWFLRRGKKKVVELGWWETAEIRGVEVTLVPAQHWSRRGLADTNETLWGGFVYQGGGFSAYHSGDTAYFSGFSAIGARFPSIDAAMLPIGAYEPRWFMNVQHMNPDDAVRAFVDLGAKRFFAMHWGTFKLTDEPLDEPPRLTRELFEERALEKERLVVPAIGETVSL
jgi:L-ascorbate metabolism protein UlaG (beta-lactamase superfamily)